MSFFYFLYYAQLSVLVVKINYGLGFIRPYSSLPVSLARLKA